MRASVLSCSRSFSDERQTASSAVHVGHVDPTLIADGTYFVHELGGEIVACGGWSRRGRLYTGSQDQDGDDHLLDPVTEAAHIRAMFVRPDWSRRGLAGRSSKQAMTPPAPTGSIGSTAARRCRALRSIAPSDFKRSRGSWSPCLMASPSTPSSWNAPSTLRANSLSCNSSRRSAASPSHSDSALQRERRPHGQESPSAVGTRPNLEGGGGQRRGSGSGLVNRLFDQLHEARRVVREAPHVARGGELDGRRSSARWAMNRYRAGSMARSWAETAYHDGRACQAPGPDGLSKMTRLEGRWSAAMLAASFGFKSWAKSSGKNCGS
jgi:hypothetical protein